MAREGARVPAALETVCWNGSSAADPVTFSRMASRLMPPPRLRRVDPLKRRGRHRTVDGRMQRTTAFVLDVY